VSAECRGRARIAFPDPAAGGAGQNRRVGRSSTSQRLRVSASTPSSLVIRSPYPGSAQPHRVKDSPRLLIPAVGHVGLRCHRLRNRGVTRRIAHERDGLS